MARRILQLEASNEELAELGRLVRGSKVSVRDRFRANIILRRLEGKSETEVAKELGCSLGAVCKWSKRFDEKGITGLKDAPGGGAKDDFRLRKSLWCLNELPGLRKDESGGVFARWPVRPG